jgi:hypothetical protein
MVPPFDERPEHQHRNIKDRSDLTIPPPGSSADSLTEVAKSNGGSTRHNEMAKLSLFLVETAADGTETLQLLPPDISIFRAVQQLVAQGTSESNRLMKVWEPTYTIVYRTAQPGDFPAPDYPWDVYFVEEKLGTPALTKSAVVRYLQQHGADEWLKTWSLKGRAKPITKSRNVKQIAAAYRDFVQYFSATSASVGPVLIQSPEKMPPAADTERASAGASAGADAGSGGGGGGGGAGSGGAGSGSGGDAHPDPVSGLLTALQNAKIDRSGPPNGITKKSIGGIVKAAIAGDRSGRLSVFLREAGWTGTGFTSDEAWLALPKRAEAKLNFDGGGGGGTDGVASVLDPDDATAAADGDGAAADGDEVDPSAKLTEQMFKLIRRLQDISEASKAARLKLDLQGLLQAGPGFHVHEEDFASQKLTLKLRQQLRDPLAVATGALPSWCAELIVSCPALFPLETRQLFFRCTAFGVSRTIHMIQSERDAAQEAREGGGRLVRSTERSRTEYRVGRLTTEIGRVKRDGGAVLDWAMNVMKVHASRKSILEIQFDGEKGTGTGPTLAFYAITATELQRKDLCLWNCTDMSAAELADALKETQDASKVDFYVNDDNGLFPMAMPHTKIRDFRLIAERFRFLGVFVAKSLQDSRLLPLPLSLQMFKLMCGLSLDIQDLKAIDPGVYQGVVAVQGYLQQARFNPPPNFAPDAGPTVCLRQDAAALPAACCLCCLLPAACCLLPLLPLLLLYDLKDPCRGV